MEFSRNFQHFYETHVYRKSALLDFASHDSPRKNDLIQKIKDNMWRLTNFYLRPLWILDSSLWVLATLVTLLSVNPWFGLILIIATTPELIVEIKT
jgi:ABC-type multidrug transport system fused ATPase/permease subunit